jgi:hypothetical protein
VFTVNAECRMPNVDTGVLLFSIQHSSFSIDCDRRIEFQLTGYRVELHTSGCR